MTPGKYYDLFIIRKTDHGFYLGEEKSSPKEEQVLLPKNQITDEMEIGNQVEVFVYMDSEDRPVATTERPYVSVGELAVLKVKEVQKIGAFLDWGLPKDLFLPYRQMQGHIYAGDQILVTVYVDKSGRLCATQKHIYDILSTDSPYQKEDIVKGRVYEFGHDFGTFVAVDDKYSGMIPRTEDVSRLKIGDVIDLRVVGVKPDGKLDLSTRREAFRQISSDAEIVMKAIDEFGGVLPFSDKANPEVIKRELNMSKAAFKRAIGHLYKERLVEIKENCVRRI